MVVKPQVIEVRIEELVLDGFAPRDRHAIADAVENGLMRLIAERGVASLSQTTTVDRVNAGRVRLQGQPRGAAVGLELAKAVFRGLSAPRTGGRPR